MLTAVLLVASCMHKEAAPQDFTVPVFQDVRYDFGSFLDRGYVVLSATLNSDNGVTGAGFVVGRNEASMSYREAERQDLTLTLMLGTVEYDTEYCFYALATNDVNEIRTKLIRLRTPKKLEDFTPSDPDDPGTDPENPGTDPGTPTDPDDPENPDNPDEPGTDPDEPDTPTTPGGTPITVSDDVFLDYLLGLCDADKDGQISSGEAAKVEEIQVNTNNIRTLDGIRYFTALKTLTANGTSRKGGLTSVDLSRNLKLEKFSCRSNKLGSFLLPSSLLELDLAFNKLSQASFKGLGKLKKLNCFANDMEELDLSPLKDLEELVCGMNSFTTLDVSANLNLQVLDLKDSPSLKTVYMAKGQRIPTIIAENYIDFVYKQ